MVDRIRSIRGGQRVLLHMPSDAEQERERAFQVLRNYVCASVQVFEITYPSGPASSCSAMLQVQRSLAGYRRIRRRAMGDLAPLRRALVLSWTSRLQLGLAGWTEDRGVVGYTNAWAPVHAYYAVYGSVRAWLAAQGHASTDHASALRAMSHAATERSVLPVPLSVACHGCPGLEPAPTYTGVPDGVTPDAHVALLGRPDESLAWPRLLKVLETTRRSSLEHRYAEWCQQRGRKRMRSTEKLRVADRVAPTTLFDVFWRMRVRANYRDAEAFMMFDVPPEWHRQYYVGTVQLTDLVTSAVENLVVQQAGLGVYSSIAREFLRWNPADGPASFLQDRVTQLSSRSAAS